jgi:hypothetical protein
MFIALLGRNQHNSFHFTPDSFIRRPYASLAFSSFVRSIVRVKTCGQPPKAAAKKSLVKRRR